MIYDLKFSQQMNAPIPGCHVNIELITISEIYKKSTRGFMNLLYHELWHRMKNHGMIKNFEQLC
jgi:hypothetical protein